MRRRNLLLLTVLVFVGAIGSTIQSAEPPSMKQVLLDPKGFDLEWSCGTKSGHSRVFFLEEGGKIVSEIRVIDIEDKDVNNPINFGAESCNSYAKLDDDGLTFYGCNPATWNISLNFDPGDRKTPFKGSGEHCTRIALNAR